MTDFTLQIFYDTIAYLAPGIVWILFTTGIIFLAMHLGKWHSDRMWRNNIKFHMPKVTQEEIKSRDEIIKTLTEELEKCREENNRLNAACAAMKNIADVMKPIEGEPVKVETKKKGASK